MEIPPPGLRTLPVLNDASLIKLGLFDAGADGRPLIATNLTSHGLRRVPNPLNFNPNTGLFMIDNDDRRLRGWSPCHPDEIAIPTYFVSYETLVFVGFTKIKAMELWKSYKKENEAADASVPLNNMVAMHQASFRLLRHGQRYLKAKAKHATAFSHLQDVGFDNSTVYVGFQPSMRYSDGSPALDAVDVFQPPGTGTKLLAWALRTTFRRFIFLCQLNAMLEGAEEKPSCATIRPSVFHWRSLISLFERNENRGVFLPEDNDISDSESSVTDAESEGEGEGEGSDNQGPDAVEIYTEEKDGVFQHGDTSKVKKEGGVFLVWDPSTVEKKGGAFQDGDASKVKKKGGAFQDGDASKVEKKGGAFLVWDESTVEKKEGPFQDGYTLKVIIEGVFPDEDTSEAETPEPFPYYSFAASEICDDDDLNAQLSEEGIVPANTKDWDSDAPDPLLPDFEKSLEKKVAKKKQELSSVQRAGITKTGDVDRPETVILKDTEAETKDSAATLKTGNLDEDKKPRDAKRDYLEEDPKMDSKDPAAAMKTKKLDEDKKQKDAKGDGLEEPYKYTEDPAACLKTEKLDEDKEPKDAKGDFFQEGPESSTNDPAAYLKTEKAGQENKPMIADADMATPQILQVRAPEAVTKKKEIDMVSAEDEGLVMEGEGDKIENSEYGRDGKD